MRQTRFLVIPLVMVFLLACGLTNGIQQIQQAATQLPAVLTSMPTAVGAVETMSAGQSSSDCGTPTAGGLGIALGTPKTVLQYSQQFTFADGQSVSTATLASAGASTFPAIADGFSAQFIGDPCNLSEIKVTIPRTESQNTADQGLAALNVLFAAVLPMNAQLPFLTWVTENYANVPVSGQQQTTIGAMQFTLLRSQTEMTLDIVPVQ